MNGSLYALLGKTLNFLVKRKCEISKRLTNAVNNCRYIHKPASIECGLLCGLKDVHREKISEIEACCVLAISRVPSLYFSSRTSLSTLLLNKDNVYYERERRPYIQ